MIPCVLHTHTHTLAEQKKAWGPGELRRGAGRPLLSRSHARLWFQGVKELSALLWDQALLLPALKLLLESQDETLHAVALERVAGVAEVFPAGPSRAHVSEQ